MDNLAESYLPLLFQELDKSPTGSCHAPISMTKIAFHLLLLPFYSVFHLEMEIYTEISMIWKKYQGEIVLKDRKLSKMSIRSKV